MKGTTEFKTAHRATVRNISTASHLRRRRHARHSYANRSDYFSLTPTSTHSSLLLATTPTQLLERDGGESDRETLFSERTRCASRAPLGQRPRNAAITRRRKLRELMRAPPSVGPTAAISLLEKGQDCCDVDRQTAARLASLGSRRRSR